MNDIVIYARDLKKVYRLYSGAAYRFLDIFGMLRTNNGAYTEHAALNGVNLDIRKGEKVAFVGRNGAGKSTLLKLITNVIQPTSGELRVAGKAHALLQIGTGFHPEFTGRQNIYAYLAQLGITGRDADLRCAEIIDFAEIEEYIDQPVKTYSSGMSVRLMFAVSTTITPDLLILDEVLGVGDAYFARKSYERIRELCDRDGTTLLLVSHDIYSAAKICNRMIWLDHGRVVADLPSSETLKLYEDAVRVQEEARLRKKSLQAIQRSLEQSAHASIDVLTVEVAFGDGRPAEPVYIARVSIKDIDQTISELRLPHNDNPSSAALTVTEGTAWGEATVWEGQECRTLQPFGSVFSHVAVAFKLPRLTGSAASQLQVEIEAGSNQPVSIVVRTYLNGTEGTNQTMRLASGWQVIDAPLFGGRVGMATVNRSTIGTGSVVLLNARILNDSGLDSLHLEHGRPCTFEFDYEIRDPDLAGPLDVAVSVLRSGVDTICRFFTRDVSFDGREAPRGTIRMHLPSVMFGVGSYSATLMISRLGYADEAGHVFYSINPGVYTCVRDIVEFEVRGGNLFATGTPMLATAGWENEVTDTKDHRA